MPEMTTLTIVCMYCKKKLGEKDGQGVSGEIGSICEDCWYEKYPGSLYPGWRRDMELAVARCLIAKVNFEIEIAYTKSILNQRTHFPWPELPDGEGIRGFGKSDLPSCGHVKDMGHGEILCDLIETGNKVCYVVRGMECGLNEVETIRIEE